jgi:hypothetical protein
MAREALIFLHIPKTAGTTLNRIIEWQYNPVSIFTVDPMGIRATVERFKTFSEKRRSRLRVVRGHLFYGIHEFLPQGGTYITMLRDPVARVISTYFFLLRRPLDPLHQRFKTERLGLEDLIRLTPNRQNLQCRFISGIGRVEDVAITAAGGRLPSTGICDERMLEIAKENLTRSFRVIGLTERFEESLALIMTSLGWEISSYENQRVTKIRSPIEPRLVDMVREHNRLDIELYNFGKKLFEENLRKNEETVKAALVTLRSVPRPGSIKRFCYSTASIGRFLTSKLASAI